MRAVHVLGIDTGFAHLGWCVARLTGNAGHQMGLQVQALGVVLTEKKDKKRQVSAGDEDWHRSLIIVREILALIRVWQPSCITCEGISFVRNSRTMSMVGRAFGILAAGSVVGDAAVLHATPQEIKLAVTGDSKASKEAVQKHLDGQYQNAPRTVLNMVGTLPKHWEHAYDALGSIVARWDDPVLMTLRERVRLQPVE